MDQPLRFGRGMKLLAHRVLPNEAKEVRADLAAISRSITAGNALNLGDQGPAVAALQRQLKNAGLYPGPVSGNFDQATADAVAHLQRARKLEASGIVGARTFAALKSTGLFVNDGFRQRATVGQSGTDVLRVERMLEKLGFRPGKVDGVMDEATAAAVEHYRNVDPQVTNSRRFISEGMYRELRRASQSYEHAPYTRRALGGLKAHRRLDDETARAAATGAGITLGAKRRVVLNLEKHLEAAGYQLGTPNRRFGPRTQAAVKAFQRHSGLPQTGVVDERTWSKLRGKLFAANSGTSPAQRVNERGAAVLRTEKQLKALGYRVGNVDGLFSENTARAVRAFQRKHRLNVTGAVGGGTAQAIKKALQRKNGGAAVQTMLKNARRWLGFRERGENGNPFSTSFGRPAEPWCADFMSYLARKAGKKLNTASAQGVANYLADHGMWKGRRSPRPGDAVTFRWDGSHGWADHVGIVEKVFRRGGQLFVQTIEGNSGDMVRRKTYPAYSSVINGYGTIR